MSSFQNNPLIQIRKLSQDNSSNLRQVASRLYDKKLKSFLTLNNKQQVLQNCQQLLIQKTVDYMNAITHLQTSQLKLLNSLNQSLNQKNAQLIQSKSIISQLNTLNKSQQKSIKQLEKQRARLTQYLESISAKYKIEQQAHYKSKIEFQKRNNLIRGEFYDTRASLQNQIKELARGLEQKTEELKSTVMTNKIQVNNIKAVKDREILELNRKTKEANSQFQKVRDQMVKENKYLQNLVEVKIDQINSLKRIQKPIAKANKRVFMERCEVLDLAILPTKIQKPQRPQTPKVLIKSKILERIKKSDDKKPEKIEKAIQKKQIQKISRDMMTMDWFNPAPVASTTKTKKVNTGCQTAYDDPFDNREITQTQLQLRYFLEQQYQNKYDQTVKQLNKRYQQEYKNTMGVIKTLLFDLTATTKQQIQLSHTKIKQIENVYCQRPSRDQDLQYIGQLIMQNRDLMSLCDEANIKTDSAYLALNQYHTKLKSYQRLVPMSILGKDEPPHIIHRFESTRYESGKQQIKTTRTQFVKNFNSIASWGLSEPATSRKAHRNGRWEDDTCEATKDLIVSQFDISDPLSPIKRKSVHSKSNNILSMRKKSGLN